MNNFYGMGGQSKGETMGFGILARVGSGVNPDAMHAERIDGYNPLAVADAVERKREVLEEGQGPVLLDTVTYRFSGHSPSDASSYRDKSEMELWYQQDALINYGEYLKENGHADSQRLDTFREEITERLVKVFEAATSLEVSPRVSIQVDSIGEMMFSNRYEERLSEDKPEVLIPKSESRLKTTLAKPPLWTRRYEASAQTSDPNLCRRRSLKP